MFENANGVPSSTPHICAALSAVALATLRSKPDSSDDSQHGRCDVDEDALRSLDAFTCHMGIPAGLRWIHPWME